MSSHSGFIIVEWDESRYQDQGRQDRTGRRRKRRSMPRSSCVEAKRRDLTEEEYQRRHEKRGNVVHSVRATQEYERMSWYRDAGIPAPTTPDPHDRQISKRQWELEMSRWRKNLREYWPS